MCASIGLTAGVGIGAALSVGTYIGTILGLILGAILDVQIFRKLRKENLNSVFRLSERPDYEWNFLTFDSRKQ